MRANPHKMRNLAIFQAINKAAEVFAEAQVSTIAQLQAENDGLRAQLEEFSAYVLTHRGRLLYCSSAMRDAYSDVVVERDQLREACEKAVEWLEGWASAEPYVSQLRAALFKNSEGVEQ